MSLLDLETTPLMKACLEKNTKLALELLEQGPDTCQLSAKSYPNFGMSSLQYACSSRLETVALRMLDYGAEANDLAHIDSTDSTALIYAIDFGLTKVANRILDFWQEADIFEADNEGNTALIHCCKNRFSKLALRLLDYGAEQCGVKYENCEGYTALDYAIENDLKNVIKKIKEIAPDLEEYREPQSDAEEEIRDDGFLI